MSPCRPAKRLTNVHEDPAWHCLQLHYILLEQLLFHFYAA